ncbi:MAG TPA: acyl-CoA dehydrogenase family protein [Syntrophales bacterium]|nr:acyl-CoA dehydrogenase family protein [Syntrophales bacterium]HPQ45137.1 acyl-CoA dehydrogenase family protein [Syntrophales bacterium]
MDYELTEGQKKLQQNIAAFCIKEILPGAQKLDEGPSEETFALMRGNLKKLGEAGFLSAGFDGDAIDLIDCFVAGEEITKACASTYVSARASVFMCGGLLKLFGTKEQQSRYLPSLLKGDRVGAVAYTEREAGTDIASIATTAHQDGGRWILNGVKDIVGNAPIGDLFLILAYTDGEGGSEKGMSVFIVEKDAKGLGIGDPIETMGLRGMPLSAVNLDDCEAQEILGQKPGEGFSQIQRILSMGTVGITSLSVGIGLSCMEKATQHAKSRKAFGRNIGSYQEVGFKLADMYTYNDLGRMLGIRAAWAMNNDEHEAHILGACAKLFSSEAATKIANMAMQIFAGHGYTKGTDIERLYRDAKFGEICEGPSEIQRTIIAKNELDKFL